MADFSTSKPGLGSTYPLEITEAVWQDLEPMLTPRELVERHLFGIPLVSRMKDPFTGKPFVFTPDMLKSEIRRAIAKLESELHLSIMPKVFTEKIAYDRSEYENGLGYMLLENRPVTRLIYLQVVPADGNSIYEVPAAWIETSQISKGQVNIVPLNLATGLNGSFIPTQTSGGSIYLSLLQNARWIPSFWQAQYCAGFENSTFPRVINEIIGVTAAIEVLSKLAATFAFSTSHSISLDGGSQSITGPGPSLFQIRIKELQEEKEIMKRALKMVLGTNFIIGSV